LFLPHSVLPPHELGSRALYQPAGEYIQDEFALGPTPETAASTPYDREPAFGGRKSIFPTAMSSQTSRALRSD